MPAARTPKLDAACAAAVDLARESLLEGVAASEVGEHLGVRAEAERLATHDFVCTLAGYHGWHWSVTVARASRGKRVTVNEVVLLPGTDAIVAPGWTPYRERLQPGDLSPGDLLPAEADDVRLVPGWFTGDEASDPLLDPTSVRPVADEVGLGRPRVLSLEGRDQAADRWYDGDRGPDNELSRQAPKSCRSCGFLVGVRGPLSTLFGVCANGDANDDGRVVSFDHGCGAHSAVAATSSATTGALPPHVVDELSRDDLESF